MLRGFPEEKRGTSIDFPFSAPPRLARREALFQVAKLAENAHALAAVCALVMKAQGPEALMIFMG
jgi:hypothetical protein